MAESAPRGIQATLFDYFQDTEYFTLQEANELVLEHQNRDVNAESIRARIYEGIDKGLFERVGKGLYAVTRKDGQGKENTCLLINGDGRDLSILPDDSVDAIITDHPYALTASLKGGNRNFADYALFQYNEKDMAEKSRVLKPGCFCVEFLPEENADNYQYLFQVKEYARKAGLEYFAKVPWKKGDFVANTGRKSKNTEDIVFFTKGRARDLRPDAKKDKAEPGVAHYMSGAHGMLPTVFDVQPPSKKDKIHQAEKPVELLKQIIGFVTLENELVLDQFGGSGVTGQAALETNRNSIIIEKDVETFRKLTERLQTLGTLQALTPAAKTFVTVGVDAMVAQDAFERTGDRSILYDFVKEHEMPEPSVLYQGEADLCKDNSLTDEQQADIQKAFDAIEDIDLRSQDLDIADEKGPCCDWCGEKAVTSTYRTLYENTEAEHTSQYNECLECAQLSTDALMEKVSKLQNQEKKVLECSSRGDKRFSAIYAKVTINGKEQSIEEWYQNSKRTADGKRAGKGKPFDHVICPFTGDQFPASEASNLYKGLWITYFSKNPDLVAYASGFDEFHDMFRGENTVNCQADVIAAYVNDPDAFAEEVRTSSWYKNMAQKLHKPSLASRLKNAAVRSKEQKVERADQSSMLRSADCCKDPWEK